jgi:hypothetical protein
MLCLIIQKDTLENDRVKSIVKTTELVPQEFVSKLQEQHCIPYQLISYVKSCSDLQDRLTSLTNDYKTVHGKDWYEFDYEVLSKIISLFLEYDSIFLDLKTISSIFGFSLRLFPVVVKEIKISPKEGFSKDSSKEENVSSLKEKEIVNMIESLQESELPRRRKDKSSKK